MHVPWQAMECCRGLQECGMMLLTKTMYINSKIGDFKSFISTDTGFGTIEWKAGKPVLNVVYGNIDVKRYNVSGKIVD